MYTAKHGSSSEFHFGLQPSRTYRTGEELTGTEQLSKKQPQNYLKVTVGATKRPVHTFWVLGRPIVSPRFRFFLSYAPPAPQRR